MKICQNCKRNVDMNARVCPYCGNAFPNPSQVYQGVQEDGTQSQFGASAPQKKDTKLPIIILSAIVAVLVIVIVCIFAFGKKDDNGSKDDGSVVTQGKVKGDDSEEKEFDGKLSDDWKDFTIEIEGEVYKFPFKYEELKNNGWKLDTNYSDFDESSQLSGKAYEWLYMKKGDETMTFYVYNAGGNALAVKDSMVGGVEWDADCEYDLEYSKGITPMSSEDEIIAAFGDPTDRYEGDDYVTLRYQIGDSYQNGVEFTCYETSDMKDYSNIEIKNFVIDENSDTETSNETPEYLSEYKAPKELGSDISSAIVNIAGDLYQLPAPLTAFTDNGWKITQKPGKVAAGNNESVTIKKDGMSLYLNINNYADYQTTVENCAVYGFSAYESDKVDLMLPGNIKIGSSKSEVEKAITDDFDYYDHDSSDSYSLSIYDDRDFYVNISVDDDTDKVSSINISEEKWDY